VQWQARGTWHWFIDGARPCPVLQWFVLNRKHAELVLADRRVERVFQQHCRTMFEPERGEERVCYPGGDGRGVRGRWKWRRRGARAGGRLRHVWETRLLTNFVMVIALMPAGITFLLAAGTGLVGAAVGAFQHGGSCCGRHGLCQVTMPSLVC
jgi:hypothetical protein